MPGPVTKKPSAVYTPPASMRGVNALEGPEAVRNQFTNITSTILQDAAVEVGTYRDRLGREVESRFDQPPVAEEVIQYQERPELVGRHPPGMQEAELDVAAAETWNPWTPRGPQVADRNPPVPPGMENVELSEATAAGEMLGSTMSPMRPELTGRNPPVPPGMESGAGMGEGTTAEAVEILGLGGGEPSPMGRAAGGATAEGITAEMERTGQAMPPGGSVSAGSTGPQEIIAEAEEWGPWTPETPYDKRRVAQEQYTQNVADRHPQVVEVIEQVVAEKPRGLQEIVKQLGEQVVQLVESIRGFSISPEEAGEIFGMSPDQLKDAYNNLARQQGRTIYEDPQAWVNLGVPPFVSEEAGAAFMGKVPAGGPTLGPGDPEYAQWNVPMEETTHGFSAKGYKGADVKGGPSPTSELRRLYPWAMNLSEDVLQRAVEEPDFLRQLIEMAESGQILPFQ